MADSLLLQNISNVFFVWCTVFGDNNINKELSQSQLLKHAEQRCQTKWREWRRTNQHLMCLNLHKATMTDGTVYYNPALRLRIATNLDSRGYVWIVRACDRIHSYAGMRSNSFVCEHAIEIIRSRICWHIPRLIY